MKKLLFVLMVLLTVSCEEIFSPKGSMTDLKLVEATENSLTVSVNITPGDESKECTFNTEVHSPDGPRYMSAAC